MNIIYHPIFLEHDTGYHPENANRLKSLGELEKSDFESGEKYLELVHDPNYIEMVRKASSREEPLDPDTMTSLRSYECAVYAAGAAVEAARTRGFAVVRPPGHHAYPHYASGFCLFNNLAIAVEFLVKKGKKVIVLDFDGHCGDGTEFIFYSTDQVLYLSIHQYPAFPGKGYVNEIGSERGKGYTINIPIPPGSADDIYLESLNTFINVAHQFKPDVVAVSAGFDAHHSDPLLNLNFSVNVFYETGKVLRNEFSQVFAVLEGGYNLHYFPQCFYNFLAGFNGQPQPFEESATRSAENVFVEYNRRRKELTKHVNHFWKIY
jgi:acetoin utilization deacetylase AcuC-like enzyme